ncbi:MAG: hypothetical protein JSU87_13530 [Gemmatimonadota bacterium]|nr:MAG: hypothetical protein JSU87_13530 [Gemmatimonadota bacterium]
MSHIAFSSYSCSRTWRVLAIGAALGGLLIRAETAAPQVREAVSLDTLPSAGNPYSSMRMLLEKTFLKVDVLKLEIRFAGEDARRIERLASGGKYSEELAESIAQIGINSLNAYARIEFVRNISLEQFVDGVREDVGKVRDAGIIAEADFEMISEGIPHWFGFLEERRILNGDQIHYRIRGDTLRTVYLGVDGDIALDQTDVGPVRRLAVLGSYLAPKSNFRKDLIKSLFRTGP